MRDISGEISSSLAWKGKDFSVKVFFTALMKLLPLDTVRMFIFTLTVYLLARNLYSETVKHPFCDANLIPVRTLESEPTGRQREYSSSDHHAGDER